MERFVDLFAPAGDNHQGLLIPREHMHWFLSRRWATVPGERPSTLPSALHTLRRGLHDWCRRYEVTPSFLEPSDAVVYRGDSNVLDDVEFRETLATGWNLPLFCGDRYNACKVYRRTGVCLRMGLVLGLPVWWVPTWVRYENLEPCAMDLSPRGAVFLFFFCPALPPVPPRYDCWPSSSATF